MPAAGFLQHFHDLAEADAEVRCRAAVQVRQTLTAESDRKNGSASEDLQYALRRLVRGAQSSRQCCRQGFSLALAELLSAFPAELSGVLQLIRQHTELQPGLKNSELKDRLLGRLFAYAAILEAGCMRPPDGEKPARGRKLAEGALVDLGKGLHEIFAMRPYLKAPAARMLADLCSELVASGIPAGVPESLGSWALEEQVGATPLDVNVAGIYLQLCNLYADAKKAGLAGSELEHWPECVRKDVLAKAAGPRRLAQAVGSELASTPLGDALPWMVAPFCKWWLRGSERREAADSQEHLWPTLEDALFPEKASQTAEAQGLRALGELALRLCEAGLQELAGPSEEKDTAAGARVEALLLGLFERMPRGIALTFRTLALSRSQAHAASVFAQQRLVEAVGVPTAPVTTGKRRKNKTDGAEKASLPLTDKTRLAILASVQQHQAFAKITQKYQREWQQGLLSHLSGAGVRTRCSILLKGLVAEGESADDQGAQAGQRPKSSSKRLRADQLLQLATHGQAPDEVILAVLCLLLTGAYFSSAPGGDASASYSLQAFCSSFNLSISTSNPDLVVPVLEGSPGDDTASNRAQWRVKLWAALVGLSRRSSPEQAAKVVAATAKENREGSEDGTGGSAGDAVLKTYAFNGCLSDGSLWIMRLHQWWDYTSGRAPGANAETPPSPRLSPRGAKKRRRSEAAGSGLQCVVPVSEADLSLRRRCVDRCHALLSESEADGSLPARQRNALCGLPLSLALALLEVEGGEDAEEEREKVRGPLEELVSFLEQLPALPAPGEASSGKQRTKALAAVQQERAKVLASVPTIAAEQFVNSSGLIKESARTAWRELGEFISDETLSGLCKTVKRGVDEDDSEDEDEDKDAEEKEEEEAEDDSEDEDQGAQGESVTARDAAKIAQYQKAMEELKASRAAEAEGSAPKAAGDNDDDEDEIVLDSEGVWEQLLGDGDEDDGSLLASFAASGLQGADAAGPKLSKRQQRLRLRQEEILKKFREVELLGTFMSHFAQKRPVSVRVLQDLHEALVAAGRRAAGVVNAGAEEKKNGGKKTKATTMLQRLEKELVQVIAKVLTKTLKQVCRSATVSAVCNWKTEEEWAEHAQALFALGESPQGVAAGQRPAEVGAVLFYWYCAVHRAHSGTSEEWTLAQKLLALAVKDWGTKRGCEKWCAALLGTFAVRAPQVLVKLPWSEEIRASRNAFCQREQVALLTTQLIRCMPPDTPGAAAFLADFAALCSELLATTLEGGSTGTEAEASAESSAAPSASQRQKLRREVLRGLSAVLRGRGKKRGRSASGEGSTLLPRAVSRQLAATVSKVRESLTHKRGEVYQLCWHVSRALSGEKDRADSSAPVSGTEPGKRRSPDSPGLRPRKHPRQSSPGADSAAETRKSQSQESSGKQPKNGGGHSSKGKGAFFDGL